MKKLLLLFLFTSSLCFSQSKMNFGAALASHNMEEQEKIIPLLVKGNAGELKKLLVQTGDEYLYSIGDISSVKVKAKNIEVLASKSFVQRMEAKNPFSAIQPLNDSMLFHNNVLPVHAGAPPLLQAYKGTGVVVGIMDTGIDFTHPDFKDSNGKTRIKFLWDQTLSTSNPPSPWNYGREYTSNAIDNNFASAHLATASAYNGHGTHVTSHAAGNGLAVNNFSGVAPEADIVFVAIDFNNANAIVDAASYIYAKANALGKPCVINASLGDYNGSHDGTDLQAQAIKALITAQNGRSFAGAAGNSGDKDFHLGYNVSSADTNFTWFSGGAYIPMYGDTATFKNIQFAIGADKPSPNYSFRGRTAFSNITPHIGVLMNDTIWNGANRLCTIQTYGDTANGVCSMEFTVTPDSNYNWRLMTTGSGKFDCWSFDRVTANMADTVIFPDLKKYKQPDLLSTTVSSFQCLDEVITVGSYTNKNKYYDADTVLQYDPSLVPGKLSFFSSHGPTRDNRIKPDITTPGEWIMGCIVVSKIPTTGHFAMGMGSYHINGGGTSYASPSCAGIAALYLQMDPSAGWQEVKNAIINCAKVDSFTTFTIPNNLWGYGKADAFASLTGCATSSGSMENVVQDDLAIYPNPFSSETTLEIMLSERSENAALKIYSVDGKELRSIPVHNSEKLILSRKGLNEGIYFCTLYEGKKIIAVKKMVISQ